MNGIPGDIQGSVTEEYQVPALKQNEIRALLSLLEKHRSLGRLATNPRNRDFTNLRR
jgi:hypothetical protein